MPKSAVDCLDNIYKWLSRMQANSLERPRLDRVTVHQQTDNGSPYSVHFIANGHDVLFESPVFWAASGDPRKLTDFYEILLGFNAASPVLKFSLVKQSNGLWRVVIGGSQKYGLFGPLYLKDVMDSFHIIYENKIPNIERAAVRLGLSFTGKVANNNLDGLLKLILRND